MQAGQFGFDQDLEDRSIEIYVHIPFCVRKCLYCDFLSFPAGREVQKQYVGALCAQIKSMKGCDRSVKSVFFGGGTPSVLEGEDIARLMETLRETFAPEPDAEISMECNPGTADREKLQQIRRAGISRLSLGVQSFDERELKALGRIHSAKEALACFELVRECGFDNINLDLMSGLPGQTVSSWEETLSRAARLGPEHISAYSLIIEEGTPYYDLYRAADEKRREGEEQDLLPGEEDERDMVHRTREILSRYGYNQYEISNYALPGKECIHNIGYWTGRDYIAFGLGASSLWEGRRFKNTDSLKEYLEGDFAPRESLTLSREDEMEEMMFLGLRLRGGISENSFTERFHTQIDTVYARPIEEMCGKGLLKRESGRIFLSRRGMDLANYVMSEFILSR